MLCTLVQATCRVSVCDCGACHWRSVDNSFRLTFISGSRADIWTPYIGNGCEDKRKGCGFGNGELQSYEVRSAAIYA
jgi:hypothetical protein